MKKSFTRRDFTKLTTAALGGAVAGASFLGSGLQPARAQVGEGDYDPSKHACRGLNECSGLGAGGDNDCAGQGTCATVNNTCAGSNECKYQGGCGAEPANNECAGEGGCHTPISDADKWAKARELFEERMAAAEKEVGPAPEA